MSGMIGKAAPTAVLMATVIWLSWPYLNEAGPGLRFDMGGDLPRISRTELNPPSVDPALRNPFQPESGQNLVASVGSDGQPEFVDPELLAGAEPVDLQASLHLTATYVLGNRGMALINGEVCEAGTLLAVLPGSDETCLVKQVTPDRVLIEHQGRTIPLTYQGL